MKLYYSPPSPFSRKARMAAIIVGLSEQVELVVVDTSNAEGPLRSRNPLGKIPTLELDTGVAIYDSAVIVAWLDEKAGGGKIIPAQGDARFVALTLEALADGVAEAAVLQVYEVRMREEGERSAKWVAYQADKVARALTALEAAPPSQEPMIGQIALACALGYLDLRFAGAWRETHPKLVAWLDAFAQSQPAFAATKVP